MRTPHQIVRAMTVLVALLAVLTFTLITPTTSRAQTATATPVSATPAPSPWSGTAPKPGQIALLVASRATTASELVPNLSNAGCSAALLAITNNGDWAVYVVGGPAFVNASFPATLTTNTVFFVRCNAADTQLTSLKEAPIESVTIVRSDDTAPIYSARIVSGLPGGCAKFERIDIVQSGTVIDLTVYNTENTPPGGACTAIYGTTVHDVSLGALTAGTEYIVRINGVPTKFMASASIPFASPQPPTGVRLTGVLSDISSPVPVGNGEQGRVTVTWTKPVNGEVDGYRVYNTDCAGNKGTAIEVASTELQYGPIQPCRPSGNIGVSATFHGRESAITWIRPSAVAPTPIR